MKPKLYALLFSALLFGCQQKDVQKTYLPRELTAAEDFNQYPKDQSDSLVIVKLDNSQSTDTAKAKEPKEWFRIKFRDTVVNVQTNKADTKAVTDQFATAEFVNTQKTSLLVQVADETGLVAPFYMITLNHNKLDVISLYRASNGSEDSRFTKGLSRIGRSGYLINNDFFITTVHTKIYTLTRKNPEQRIQGLHFVTSPDKKTLVFLTANSLYQVNYPTGKSFNQPLPSKMPEERTAVYQFIQNNYSWKDDGKGNSFLKADADDNRIIDIREFN